MLSYPGHETLRELRKDSVVDLDGLLFVMVEGDVAPGDMYIGARNTVDIYVCASVNTDEGWVHPEGIGYPFDLGECIKVREADKGATAGYVVPRRLLVANAVKPA